MSDHYHYLYASDRHDHGNDYAEKHHRHYDLENEITILRGMVAELREDLRDALERIHALEDRQPDYGDEDGRADDETLTCSSCGALIGMFTGRQGWHHYRGDGTTASPVEIYDAGHEATFAGQLQEGRS